MSTPLNKKSSVDQIRERFDQDVERFSNLQSGQSATIDAPLAMELITEAAVASHSDSSIETVLDIGCGAGNNSLKLRALANYDIEFDLLDISKPMLERAEDRLKQINRRRIRTIQEDIRHAEIADASYDVILAAAVLHHLRDDGDWEFVFTKLFRILKPGGSLWITDLVGHETESVQDLMWQRYGRYLETLGGSEYRDKVFDYIDQEDSPRSVTYQVRLLERVGFKSVEILHKNSCFAAFGAIK